MSEQVKLFMYCWMTMKWKNKVSTPIKFAGVQ